MRYLLCAILLLMLPSAVLAAEPPTDGTAPSVVPAQPYRIASDDVLDITVQDHADLSKVITVPLEGTITYPYMGEFSVVGLTLHQLDDRITEALKTQIVNPQVITTLRTLHTQSVAQVSALGAVKSPGKRPFKRGWRILDLLIDSGGLSVSRPELVSAALIRGGSEFIPVQIAPILTTGDAKANLPLQPEDVLLVTELEPSVVQIQVLGEVAKPGSISAPKDGSITSVLSAAGGPTAKAALSKATLTHQGKTISLDLRSALTGGLVTDIPRIEPGDTLFIPQNRLWYAVFGAVAHPGQQDYPETQSVTVLSALSAAGQATDADLKDASLIHPSKYGQRSITRVNVDAMMKKGDISNNLTLQPGDILYIPSKQHKRGVGLVDALTILPYAVLLHLVP